MESQTKEFMKYPSIENTYNAAQIDGIRKSKFSQPNFTWAALEKIHGANFSIHCTENAASYCRRNDFISKPIPFPCEDVQPYFIQNFFNCHKLVQTFHNKIEDVYKAIKSKFPEMNEFNLFGEYFGGCWPGVVNEEIPPVQLGLYYSPNHHFYVFDCSLNGSKQRWLSVKEVIQIIGSILPVVPVHQLGTFEQVFAANHVFDSTIPSLLGNEINEKNTCEGLILRMYDHPHHILCKKKNDQFLEMTNTTIPLKQREKQKLFNDTLSLITQLQNYLNKNRIASAYSKMPDAELFQMVDEVANDILQDARKNGIKFMEDKESLDKILRNIKGKATGAVAKYLQEVRGYVSKKQKKVKAIVEIPNEEEVIKNVNELDLK